MHLRFGPVARGGLRWSDRAQDYRTEVLGLVKAQQVKNAVIVPVGAKGGFFPKRLPVGGSRDAIFEAGTKAYVKFVSSLLSITDNLDGAAVVPPKDVVRHDSDDPYFVVAADKGTATFSDTANGISQKFGFWLDDAFASGGSAGYDHKKMGITARGAWEAVKRHFREMNRDIQTSAFTVVGVGDMSGDVFGNGMLLSEKTRLIAAFDHRDIFIDPDPDEAASFDERARLFALPRSSWQDYDKTKLSKGGVIVSRSQKSVALSAEAAAAIGLGKTDRLADRDHERHPQGAGRPALVRRHRHLCARRRRKATPSAATAPMTRSASPRASCGVKVIGEGANLGVTQRARIEFGLARRRLQFRRDRQFGRRQFLRRRGQHQDRAGDRDAQRRAHQAGAQQAAGRDDRRGGRSRARQQLPADAGAFAGAPPRARRSALSGALHVGAGITWPARPCRRDVAERAGARRT